MGKILDEKREKNAQKKIKELYFQRKLHHKNITGLYGFYEIKTCSCIAMDYVRFIIEHKNLLNSNLINSKINDWINNIFGIGQYPTSPKVRENSFNIFIQSSY